MFDDIATAKPLVRLYSYARMYTMSIHMYMFARARANARKESVYDTRGRVKRQRVTTIRVSVTPAPRLLNRRRSISSSNNVEHLSLSAA